MRFGTRAKLVKNKATKNEEKSVAEYKLLLHQANLKLGIQATIIAALEKDVAALMECVAAVDEGALRIPIPELMSRDVAVLDGIKTSKLAEGQADGAAAEAAVSPVAGVLDLPAQLPPVVLSPAPPVPVPVAAAAAAAASSADAAAAATVAPVAVTPVPAPVLSTPVKPTARAVRRPTAITAGSGDNSPATSPDTSPDSSPRASPVAAKSPPVVLMGLPSLESLAAAAAPAASPTAAAASAASPTTLSVPSASTPTGTGGVSLPLPPAHRKLSASIPGHSLSDLMLANSDLQQQVAELRQARQALEHNLEDNKKEAQEAAEEREKDKAAAAAAVEEERRLRREAEERAEKASEVVGEVELLKKKIEYMKKEQGLALSQAQAARMEAAEEAARLAARLAHLEAAARDEEGAVAAAATAATAAQEAEAAAAAEEARTSTSQLQAAASAPTTPVDTEKKKFRPRMSAPPEHMHHASAPNAASAGSGGGSGSGSSGFHRSSYSMSTSLGASGGGAAADYGSIEEQSQIEQLSRGLKRKCDQVVELMIQHQAQGERMEQLESSLEESNARLREHMAASSRKIKELDEKLLAAENLCAKFLESGRYWRQERNQKQKATSSKISMPMHGGGGGGKARTDGGGSGVMGGGGGGSGVAFGSPGAFGTGATTPGAMSPAPSGPGGGGSSVSSPAPASASSRLSGGLALGARNAITSIQSAISGKPKDNMSVFF